MTTLTPGRGTALAALAVVALLLVGCTPRHDVEAQLLDDLNQRRAAHGLPALAHSQGLQDAARGHVVHRVTSGPGHAADLTGGGMRSSQRFGENIARGPSGAAMPDARWNSPGHRALILGDHRNVGVGVFQDDAGTLWAAFRFEG